MYLRGELAAWGYFLCCTFLKCCYSEMPWDTYFCVWKKLYDLTLYDTELSGLNNIKPLKAFSLVSAYFRHLRFLSFFLFFYFVGLFFFVVLLAFLMCP